jgi:S-adenosylmethionine decarboxylase
MFTYSKSCGKHLICDIKAIKNKKLLNNLLDLKLLCKNICIDNNYTILGELEHEFTPQGFSFVFLLSESHLSIHTFPERDYLAFDLFTCRSTDDSTIYIEIYNELCKKLEASLVLSDYKITERFF